MKNNINGKHVGKKKTFFLLIFLVKRKLFLLIFLMYIRLFKAKIIALDFCGTGNA